jgi:hypothetical protein
VSCGSSFRRVGHSETPTCGRCASQYCPAGSFGLVNVGCLSHPVPGLNGAVLATSVRSAGSPEWSPSRSHPLAVPTQSVSGCAKWHKPMRAPFIASGASPMRIQAEPIENQHRIGVEIEPVDLDHVRVATARRRHDGSR